MDITSYLLGKKTGGGGKGSLKYVIVDELPTVGEDNTIYLVPKETEGTNNYYDEYMYINNSWEKIGDTEVDLSSKQDVMQFTSMPSPSASIIGKIIQYVGTTDATYTNGYFYQCVSDGGDPVIYSWRNIDTQSITGPVKGIIKYGIGTVDISDWEPGIYFYDYQASPANQQYAHPVYVRINNSSSIYFNIGDFLKILKKPGNANNGQIIAEWQYANDTQIIKGQLMRDYTGTNKYQVNYYYTKINTLDTQQIITAKKTYNILPESSIEPTTNNQFVIKKYVDNKPTTYSGYDATKTQVLKNINGTLTWVDEA